MAIIEALTQAHGFTKTERDIAAYVLEQGVDGLAAEFRKLGIDEKMLDEAISSMKAERNKS